MPAPSVPQVQTSAQALLAGKHEVGTDVVVDLIVLRAPFLRINTGGRHRHFAFAVAADSEFLVRLGELKSELAAFLVKQMPRARKELKRWKGAVVEVKYGERLIREAQNLYPDPAEAIAIELDGTIEGADWFQVSHSTARSERLGQVPWLAEDGTQKWALDGYPIENMPADVTIRGATAQVSELLKATPPKMDQLVPNMNVIALYHVKPSEVSAYNRLVQLANKEILRRRVYGLELLEPAIKLVQAQLEDLTGAGAVSLTARVVPLEDSEMFDGVMKAPPKVLLRESSSTKTLADQLLPPRRTLEAPSDPGPDSGQR